MKKSESSFNEIQIHSKHIDSFEQRLSKLEKNTNKRFYASLFFIALCLGFFMGVVMPDISVTGFSMINEDINLKDKNTPNQANVLVGGQHTFEPLRGDTVKTDNLWKLNQDHEFHVHIIDDTNKIPQGYIDMIISSVTSNDSIVLDDFKLHKGPRGSQSTYYLGWAGALNSLDSSNLEFSIPSNIHIHESRNVSDAEVVIRLVSEKHAEGYSGFTHSIMDTSNNEILKSFITIYDSHSLTVEEMSTIAKHEMGHALGLAHSTDPTDLMYPQFQTQFNISECNVKAIAQLYDGKTNQNIECEK